MYPLQSRHIISHFFTITGRAGKYRDNFFFILTGRARCFDTSQAGQESFPLSRISREFSSGFRLGKNFTCNVSSHSQAGTLTTQHTSHHNIWSRTSGRARHYWHNSGNIHYHRLGKTLIWYIDTLVGRACTYWVILNCRFVRLGMSPLHLGIDKDTLVHTLSSSQAGPEITETISFIFTGRAGT